MTDKSKVTQIKQLNIRYQGRLLHSWYYLNFRNQATHRKLG